MPSDATTSSPTRASSGRSRCAGRPGWTSWRPSAWAHTTGSWPSGAGVTGAPTPPDPPGAGGLLRVGLELPRLAHLDAGAGRQVGGLLGVVRRPDQVQVLRRQHGARQGVAAQPVEQAGPVL